MADLKRKAKIAGLSNEARIELIALLFFDRRADRNPKFWNSDLHSARLQLHYSNVFETDNLGDYIRPDSVPLLSYIDPQFERRGAHHPAERISFEPPQSR